jgi:phenylalanyl-tRNA synthetase alpha chain
MIERIEQLRAQASAEIDAADTSAALEELRVRYLGRKAELPQMLRSVAELEPAQRGAIGKAANQARQALEAQIEARVGALSARELDDRLAADTLDVTLPGAPPQPIGSLHVLTSTRRELEDIFLGLGFTVMEGPEVESVH